MGGLFSTLSFGTPLALLALGALPVIWWLLRFTPPRPETVRFPPLRLLLKLRQTEEQPDRTPWWLMALRLVIAALTILAVAHPALAPQGQVSLAGGPLLLIVDDDWAAAPRWGKRQEMLAQKIDEARRGGVPVTLAMTVPETQAAGLDPVSAEKVSPRLATLAPKAIEPDRMGLLARLQETFATTRPARIVWLSDGLDHGSARAFAEGLSRLAPLTAIVPGPDELPATLGNPRIDGGKLRIQALRVATAAPASVRAQAIGRDGRLLGDTDVNFAPNRGMAEASFDLPVELRNDVARIALASENHAAARFILDDRWRRKTVALMAGGTTDTAQPLLAPLHYVQRALEPAAEQSQPADATALQRLLDGGLSMLVLADVGVLPEDAQAGVRDFVGKGGVLLRFAGPRFAAAQDSLIPVTIREGGRSLDSALSWETPQPLQPFPPSSPFAGLALDDSVRVSRQVLAEPDVDLPGKVWAALADGTPLVTARREGKGWIVLFHVTANADWSNLPLSGLYAEMLQRIVDMAPAAGALSPAADNTSTEAQVFTPQSLLSGAGDMITPPPDVKPIAAAAIDKAKPSAETPPGLYQRAAQTRAINIAGAVPAPAAIGNLPAGVSVAGYAAKANLPIAPYLIVAALIFLIVDSLIAMAMAGKLRSLRLGRGAAIMVAGMLFTLHPQPAHAGADDDFAMKAALDTHLAYVLSGDASIDRVSEEGLKGLGYVLRDRTSVEPADPVGIDIEKGDISFFPLLYWPVRADAPVPSDKALAKMAQYMKNGGTLFFDLREDGAGMDMLAGGESATAQALQRMLAKLDIPPLEPVPPEHVLTHSFYLLQSFPGRYDQGTLWVERADAASSATADGISSIIIGANDYAAAWAVNDAGDGTFAMSSGNDRQREMAFRAGVNIVMYALTGNYKADQVHVPALLERLGQ